MNDAAKSCCVENAQTIIINRMAKAEAKWKAGEKPNIIHKSKYYLLNTQILII